MIAVLDVNIGQVRPPAHIEGNIVLPNNSDLRDRIAFVDQHPVKAVVLVDQGLVVFRPRREAVLLRAGLPDCQGACLVPDSTVLLEQELQPAGAARTGRPCQHLSAIPGKLAGHEVSHGHSLHEDTALVDVVPLLHPIQQRENQLCVMGFANVLRSQRQERGSIPLTPDAFHLPHPPRVCIREDAEQPLPVRDHGPGGINGMAPAGHQPSVHPKNKG